MSSMEVSLLSTHNTYPALVLSMAGTYCLARIGARKYCDFVAIFGIE